MTHIRQYDYSYLTFDKCREIKLDPCFSLFTKIYSKWIKDPSIIAAALKILKEKVGNYFCYTNSSKHFLNRTAMNELRPNIDKRDRMK